jgi:C-terminal processing protease CtpA/Prc
MTNMKPKIVFLFSIPSLVVFLFFAFVMLTSCSTKIPQHQTNYKFAKEKLQQDVTILKKVLEANHPSLYWYTSKDSLDQYFANLYNSLADSMTELQFKNKVAQYISNIHCGHTSVRFSKQYIKQQEANRFPQFPLSIKTWKDSMVVLGSIYKNDSIFKRGTIITSINGRKNKQMLDSFFMFMSTDGYSNNFKSQVVTFNFGNFYKNIFGLDSLYHITYIDTTGKEKMATLKNFQPKKDTTQKPSVAIAALEKPSRKEIREAKLLSKHSMSIDTANSMAYLRLTTFSQGQQKKFYRQSFRKIKKMHLQNVVIDVRENGGGSFSNSIKLTRYLKNTPYRVADSIVAINKIKYSKYVHPSLSYKIAMFFTGHKKPDGNIHLSRYEKHAFPPKKNNHYNGNVYIIQGGYTFSAATMFVQSLQGQSNITVVGEETGGGHYGNTAVHLPNIVLPNSGLRVVLPIYKMVFDSTRVKDGHGIMPDILIQPSSDAIKRAVDLKMETIRALIKRKKL